MRWADNLTSFIANCLEIWDPQPPGTLRACPGLQWVCFTLLVVMVVVVAVVSGGGGSDGGGGSSSSSSSTN